MSRHRRRPRRHAAAARGRPQLQRLQRLGDADMRRHQRERKHQGQQRQRHHHHQRRDHRAAARAATATPRPQAGARLHRSWRRLSRLPLVHPVLRSQPGGVDSTSVPVREALPGNLHGVPTSLIPDAKRPLFRHRRQRPWVALDPQTTAARLVGDGCLTPPPTARATQSTMIRLAASAGAADDRISALRRRTKAAGSSSWPPSASTLWS